MALIDVHAHIYPEKIAEKASASVGEFYHVPMYAPGSIECLLGSYDQCDITHAFVHSVANKPTQVESINNFIAASCEEHSEFIGFMTMHQDYEDMAAEVDRAIGLGLRGIKLHPDSQQVDMDDERLLPLYEIAEKRNLPVIIHCGDYRYDYSHPRRLKRLLHEFPGLVVNAAHFGGWMLYDYSLEFLENEKCFIDVSSAMSYLGSRRSRELIEAYGTDRTLFGSDFPMWSPAGELEKLEALGFSARDFEAMTWRNAEAFLGMDVD